MTHQQHTTLSDALHGHPTWESLYSAAQYPIKGHAEKYRTDPLPIPAPKPIVRVDRTDCRYLEAVPFKAHCFCHRLAFEQIVHEADCKNCKRYTPKPKES